MAPRDPMSDAGDSQHEHYSGSPPHGDQFPSDGAGGNGAAGGGGMLARIGDQLPSVAPLNWSYGPPPRPEILSAKPNPLELLHAVRRRLPLAVGIGTLVSLAIGAALWFVIPVKYEAYSQIKISVSAPAVLSPQGSSIQDFELFKATQQQMFSSHVVVNGVLRDPGINQLSTVREHSEDPVSWLKGALNVDFPGNAELMRVSIKTKRKDDSLKIVNKAVEVYLKEIVQFEKNKRLENENKLQTAANSHDVEYRRELDALKTLERVHKTSGSEAAQLKKQLAVEELNTLLETRRGITAQLTQNEMGTLLIESRLASPQAAIPPEVMIDMELERDPAVAQLKQQLLGLQQHLSQIQGVATNHDSTPYMSDVRRQIMHLEESIVDLKAQNRQRLMELYASTPATEHQFPLTREQLSEQKKFFEGKLAELDQKIATKTEEVSGLDSYSSQVAAAKENVERQRMLKDEIATQVERIRIERLAPERITKLEDAVLDGGGDAIRKYMSVAFAMLLSFSSVLLCVAILEFQSRKVNSVKEVNDGLGIRVVGELPNVGGRAFRRLRGGKGQHILKALMAERIDGTRTALIHTTAIDPPRVVMVTSADPREGKTTTATQLAASLARSGRRTLLIDADVRNPGAHRVFEMPLDPGLCELLRGEADRDAVLHPTRTANLWLMPGGRCDLRSVQALSGSYLGSTIAALSVQFDYVIIDAGPVLKVADPLLVGQHVDAAIISVLKDVSRVPQVYEAVERLRSVGITVLGSVVNGVKDDVARHGVELLMAETPRDQEPAESTSVT